MNIIQQQQKYTQIQQIFIIRSISASQDYFPCVFLSSHLTIVFMVWTLSPLLSEVWSPLYWRRQTASCLFVVSGICAYSSNLKYFIGQCYKPLSAAVVSGRVRDFSLSVGTGVVDERRVVVWPCGGQSPKSIFWEFQRCTRTGKLHLVDIFKLVARYFPSVTSSFL